MMTATKVSRNFASVLDCVEPGETIGITRRGRRLGTPAPAPAGNGGALREFLMSHTIDDEFASDVASARDAVSDELGATWSDA